MSDVAAETTATRVVLSYDPAAIDDVSRHWVEDELSKESFEGSIRRTRRSVSEDETFDEFVSKGCGVPVDVTLRVEQVEGGADIDEATTVDIRPRD